MGVDADGFLQEIQTRGRLQEEMQKLILRETQAGTPLRVLYHAFQRQHDQLRQMYVRQHAKASPKAPDERLGQTEQEVEIAALEDGLRMQESMIEGLRERVRYLEQFEPDEA